MTALAKNERYVPFTASVLTKVLRELFVGDCETVVLASVAPTSLHSSTTKSTLEYASQAQKIKVKVRITKFFHRLEM